MASDHFTFETSAFLDTDEVLAKSVNAIHGYALAAWLGGQLREHGLTVSEPWAEDHGWDFSITHAGAAYLCACSVETGDGSNEAHVQLGKHRSAWERLTGRNALLDDDPVAARIAEIVARAPKSG